MIRKARDEDFESILEIYNYEVENGVATFDTEPYSYEKGLMWFKEHNRGRNLLLVAEEDGIVLGYAALSEFSDRRAYDSSREVSLYLSKDARGRGIGTKLLKDLVRKAEKRGDITCMISKITDINDISKKVHEKCGFEKTGTLVDIGYKKGSFHSVDIYQIFMGELKK